MSDNRETFTYEQFVRLSAERQSAFNSRYGDRELDMISKSRPKLIRSKISWYVFNKDYDNLIEEDDNKEKTAVDTAFTKLKKVSDNGEYLLLGCFYIDILLKEQNTVGIIPILKTKNQTDGMMIFYEPHSGRVYYGGCETYEKDNRLPKCWMCYPPEGIYRSQGCGRRVILKYCESRSCHDIFPAIDVISLVGGGLCTAVMAVSVFFPPLLASEVCTLTAAAGVITTGIYSVGRGIYELCDRNQHEQSCDMSDPAAFRQWLNIILAAGSTLTAGGAVIMKAAALKGAANSATFKLAANILRYVSVGVNGLGMIVIVIDLVIKYMNNRLELQDLRKFMSLCLLISNIVISTDQAKYIIQIIAEQPQRLRNTFNMVRNTAIVAVKCIIDNVPWTQALHLITGDVGMNILRHIGFHRTADMISFVRDRIRRCIREGGDIAFVLLDILQHCFLFFTEILQEVREATRKIEKWFGNALYRVSIGNNRVFKNSSNTLALDITDEVERVLDDIEIKEDTVRDDSGRNIIDFVNDVANEASCETDVEYMKITELVSDRLRKSCTTELIVRQVESTDYLTDKSKRDILRRIISDLEQSPDKDEIVELFKKQKYFSEIKKTLALWKPVYQTANDSVYFFETSSNNFNQFVYDAACELLKTEDIFTRGCEIFLHSNDLIFCVRDGDKSLIFNYDIERSNGTVKGIAILYE